MATKKKVKKLEWKPVRTNSILSGRGFYISYNPDTNDTSALQIVNSLGKALGIGAKNAKETALVKRMSNGKHKYLILDGDFRKEYEKLVVKGYAACKKFYLSKPKSHSLWSTE